MVKKLIITVLMLFVFSFAAKADDTPKIFSLGRSVGASYYHLIDLSDKAERLPFSKLQKDYGDAFQNMNIIDIVLEDLQITGKSRDDLNKLRINLYNALQNREISHTQLTFVRDMYVAFYENLAQDITTKYLAQGSWLLSLGFYTSFQTESLNSGEEEKILLSGFDKIYNVRPISVPENIQATLLAIYNLDKLTITQAELAALNKNIKIINDYFTNYPDLTGVWQGILINPEDEKYDVRLTVNKNQTARMDIKGVSGDVTIPDVRIINNYFSFMFKPFGTEKLYLRFDARVADNIFTGEITDTLGSKGYWVLAKTDKDNKLTEDSLKTMVSYVSWIEEKIKGLPEVPVDEILLPAPEKTPSTR